MIVLDTSFIVAYKIENDNHHAEAVKIFDEIVEGKYGKPVISDYIFDETITVVFKRSKKLAIAAATGDELKDSVEILVVDSLFFEDGWKTFKDQDNNFSFTDCTTLALMKKKNIENIATFDEDFKEIKEITAIGLS